MTIEEQGMTYIKIGTRQIEQTGVKGIRGKVSVGAPYRFYAVSHVDADNIGNSPFYRIEGVVDDMLRLRELKPETREYNKIRKWAGEMPQSMKSGHTRAAQRSVLSNNNPGCKIDVMDVVYAFTGFREQPESLCTAHTSSENAGLELRL